MITMVSTIANGGEYIRPRIVKQIIEGETGKVRDVEIKKEQRVISNETSGKMLSMMESVVAEGTGKNAKVEGYRIGGKTGTSEDGVNTGKYVTSFIGVAPIENPELAILITLYNPTGEGGHQGGGVAAPIGNQVLSEVLPYLEVKKINENEEEVKNVVIPNLIGLTLKEAKNILKDLDLNLNLNGRKIGSDEIIKNQMPISGVEVRQKSNIIVEF